MADSIGSSSIFATEGFRVKVEETANPTSRRSLAQTVESFNRFMGGTPVPFDNFNDELLNEWVSWLFSRGYSYNTVTYYVKRLSSLYGKVVKDGATDDNGCFSRVKAKLANASKSCVEINSDPDCFRKLHTLAHTNLSKSPARQLAKDMVLFAIYNGGLTFKELASYKKTDYTGHDSAILDIVGRYSKPKNKYLFPINQSERTPNQLDRIIEALFSDALRLVNIKLSSYKTTTAIDLWAAAAMRCGISASDIASCIGRDGLVNPAYSFATKKEISTECKEETLRLVSRMLTMDPDNWYAMQFRPRVSYDMIKARMKAVGIPFRDTFYPMEEIVRRIGKKTVRESRPVVPGLLFFRCKAAEVHEIFFNIGDLAWGYRQTRAPRSPYAVISNSAIRIYQHTIGQFTEGMEIYPEGTIKIEAGDRVKIIGGDLIGHHAIFQKEIRRGATDGPGAGRIIYRLKLMGDNSIEWVVNLDPRLVRPLPTLRPANAQF